MWVGHVFLCFSLLGVKEQYDKNNKLTIENYEKNKNIQFHSTKQTNKYLGKMSVIPIMQF